MKHYTSKNGELVFDYDAEDKIVTPDAPTDAEPTIEEQNDALLQFVNDKTNGNHADLSAAVESLVNNIKQ